MECILLFTSISRKSFHITKSNFMSNGIYLVTGQVIDRTTRQGVVDLVVQAWDTNPERAESLGTRKPDENGRFSISLGLEKLHYESPPDLFFKVLQNENLIDSTESSVTWNAHTQESVTINVRLGREPRTGKDRITSEQFFKAANFFQKSDFKGVIKEYSGRSKTSVTFIADMFKNSFSKMDIKPITVTDRTHDSVINQDVEVATNNLESKKIRGKEGVEYQPGLNLDSIKSVASMPVTLKPGQEVRLYQENGKVRYYSIVKTREPVNEDVVRQLEDQTTELAKMKEELKVNTDNFARTNAEATKTLEGQANELTRLREELKSSQEDAAKKDVE